mmetsp:Transcript_27422/g.54902  ORF Transcript_27422/g.54902 Transcript_27422/m.54902 type:complete len:538 (-) Transcript_27422:249-1862(-)
MPIDTKCMEKVDLFISAKDLPKIPIMSETDAFSAVFMKNNRTKELDLLGMTPVIKDTPNPSWSTCFTLDYMFEVEQEITIRTYHYHDGSAQEDFGKHTFLGEATFLLASLMVAHDQKMSPKLVSGKATGSLDLRAESHTNTRDLFCAAFQGIRLSNKDGFFGTSDPFLVISRMNEDGQYTVVWKSSKIDNSLNPVWGTVKISMNSLCNGDVHRPLKIEIFDWDSNGKHDTMGHVETSVQAMISNPEAQMDVIEPAKVKTKKTYTNSGHLVAGGAHIEHHPTFTQFLAGGCEISLITAIDFTGSNGDPELPSSLHYISPTGAMNPYQGAISAVGRILDEYDTNKRYPVYGFGAKVREDDDSMSECQHCLPLNEGGRVGGDSTEVHGIPGILKAYKDCIPKLFFSGPTLFAPLINAATGIAAGANCRQEQQKYTVLLIITDGMINDMEATKAAVVAASGQPMSIIIVGVGSADFSGMKVLDDDKGSLRAGGKAVERDIVQFVQHTNEEFPILAQKVLEEIPDQLLKYMESHHIMPNKKK